MKFEPGSLYKPRIDDKEFPGFRGTRHVYTSENNDIYFNKDSIVLIVEPLFILRNKLRSTKENPGLVRYDYWVCKVMIDDKVGYIEMWEDEWDKIS